MGPEAGAKPRIRDGMVLRIVAAGRTSSTLAKAARSQMREGPNPSSPAATRDGASVTRLLCLARTASQRAVGLAFR